jgi:alginate O-acetyltransferase complex protein AlgI
MSLVSPVFLFLFLPLCAGAFFVLGPQSRNYCLLFFSLFLYFFASPDAFFILVAVCSIACLATLQTERFARRRITTLCITAILFILCYYKYGTFTLENINIISEKLFSSSAWDSTRPGDILLPIGISFYTFQAISLIVDWKKITLDKSRPTFFQVFLYISFFPQLVAGPIVRFRQFFREVNRKTPRKTELWTGIRLVAIGLGKKVLIADFFASYVDVIFSLPPAELSWQLTLLGTALFFFQIYFDFSGYSDMAIGLARIFKIRFYRNFKYPYISLSVTEFWRRWHISLSRWFRDYVYIPLGGNRRSQSRTFFNLLLVFCLCGIWHGASWTFLLWGAWNGLFLIFERIMGRSQVTFRPNSLIRWAYTFVVVMVGWLIFRSNNIEHLSFLIMSLLELQEGLPSAALLSLKFDLKFYVIVIASVFASFSFYSFFLNFIIPKTAPFINSNESKARLKFLANFFSNLFILAFGFIAIASVARGTFTSFIYFQF